MNASEDDPKQGPKHVAQFTYIHMLIQRYGTGLGVRGSEMIK
jgi:hypothetical protein